jgi:isopentenyl diphosphate isomerase/L-lactate dehydrogenase-like FMN-dependent dehydrogenase
MGPDRLREIYLGAVQGTGLRVPVDFAALEGAARAAMSPAAFAYVAGAAGRESTVAANRGALDAWRIRPRMLRDVEARDPSLELFGRRLPWPFLLAPVGVLELAHPRADRAVARAASALGVPMIFSNQASVPMEACAAEMGDAPRWFQLYWSKNDDLVASLVARAEACSCDAIVVTLDTTLLGWRPRDLDFTFLPFLKGQGIAQYTSDPVFLEAVDRRIAAGPSGPKPRPGPAALALLFAQARNFPGSFWRNLVSPRPRAAVQEFIETYSRPSLTWDDLAFLRKHTRLPILLKGILHPDDARRALDEGVDGLVVSNHGGRQVDGAVGAAQALLAVVEAVADRVPVLFDSGIRGGSDVFKALALGARAVLLGRPYVYGLAVAGEAGVGEVIRNLAADFDLTLGLSGCHSLEQITAECLEKAP